jgi:hypothetical protein
MIVRYSLTVSDHMAWFDYHTVYVGKPWFSRLPIFGAGWLRSRRKKKKGQTNYAPSSLWGQQVSILSSWKSRLLINCLAPFFRSLATASALILNSTLDSAAPAAYRWAPGTHKYDQTPGAAAL